MELASQRHRPRPWGHGVHDRSWPSRSPCDRPTPGCRRGRHHPRPHHQCRLVRLAHGQGFPGPNQPTPRFPQRLNTTDCPIGSGQWFGVWGPWSPSSGRRLDDVGQPGPETTRGSPAPTSPPAGTPAPRWGRAGKDSRTSLAKPRVAILARVQEGMHAAQDARRELIGPLIEPFPPIRFVIDMGRPRPLRQLGSFYEFRVRLVLGWVRFVDFAMGGPRMWVRSVDFAMR
jgi:hypothetical protein